ncbi:hypothetical protein FOL47_002343 [Perkinsus chesapeaki]|uniref:Uncharacterized protein n=1 Tax=Perkinsus chesapeaki TaxID=330153 RepID=A0A7J6ME04_PERCH|nr:hypothetical protein FOL47_002343 [Perkinsus chesapeaki]
MMINENEKFIKSIDVKVHKADKKRHEEEEECRQLDEEVGMCSLVCRWKQIRELETKEKTLMDNIKIQEAEANMDGFKVT